MRKILVWLKRNQVIVGWEIVAISLTALLIHASRDLVTTLVSLGIFLGVHLSLYGE